MNRHEALVIAVTIAGIAVTLVAAMVTGTLR